MNKKPFKYTEWIKHSYDFKVDSKIILYRDDQVSILAHPAHPRIFLNLNEDIINQVYQQPKSLQLYFFGFVWIGFCEFKEERDAKVISKILEAFLSYAEKKPELNRKEMIWDDHALSERACVFLYLKDIDINVSLNNDIENHLFLLNRNLDEILNSKKWVGNNHRIFHLCAKYCLEKYYYKNVNSSLFYLSKIESFFLELIDIVTGLSVEQSVSYYNFDVLLLDMVHNFIVQTGESFTERKLDAKEITNNKNQYVNALAFPDGELPASGDTPLGLKLKPKHIAYEERQHLWSNLERLGHYRNASDNDQFHVHMLAHNAENAHGHHSPLHIDLWSESMGMLLVDSGGPYKYGDTLRHKWFRASDAHNTVTFLNTGNSFHKTIINRSGSDLQGVYCSDGCFLAREVVVKNNMVLISDTISSDTNWFLSFHFSESIDLKLVNDKSLMLVKDKSCILVEISYEDTSGYTVSDTYVTRGGGKKSSNKSLIINGAPGLHKIAVSFKND